MPARKESPYSAGQTPGGARSLSPSGRALLAALLAAALWPWAACSTVKWWESCPAAGAPAAAARVEAEEQLIVYLDVSESMKGFVAERRETEAGSAQTLFSKALLELRNVVSTLSPQPRLALRAVDTEVHPAEDVFRLTRYAVNRDWFRGDQTNLAGAFKAFAEAGGPGPDGRPGAAPARFHILVTDGVQSSRAGRPDMKCLQGSDPHCVKGRINELLSMGWGGSILGLRSDFDGEVFSEVRPKWSVRHSSEPDNPATFRPCYFYIFSPDRAALDKLVKALKDGLRPLLRAEDQLREYALTAPYFEGTPAADFTFVNEAALAVSAERTAPAGSLSYFNVDVSMPAGQRPPAAPTGAGPPAPDAQLTLRVPWSHHALDSGTKQEVGGLLRWELRPDASQPEPGALYPQLKVVGSTANADGSVTLQLAAKWDEGVGKRRERVYCLVGLLDLEKDAPPWVEQWSADTDETPEEATRTLNLKVSLSHLWNNQSLQQQELAVACLRVGDL